MSLFVAYAQNDCHLTVLVKNENATAAIPNFEVRICQVAYQESGVYHLTDGFSSSGISMAELNKNNNAENAKAIVNYINENSVDYQKTNTNASGKAVFANLSRGIYVVFAKSEQSVDFSPFIVFLPHKTNGTNNHYVTSTPKTTGKDDKPGGDEGGGGGTSYKTIPVTKIWDDNNNSYEKRPETITVNLTRNGISYKKVVLSEKNSWKYTFRNLPLSGDYDVKEDTVNEYSATYSGNANTGFIIINKYNGNSEPKPPTETYADISVTKVWEDNNNEKNKRPDSVTIQLVKDGEVFKTSSLNENNSWKYTFVNLDKRSKYTIKEILPENYSVTYSGNVNDGFIVTNKYTEGSTDPGVIPEPDYPTEPENTKVKVKKIWDDNNNESGKRPDRIVVSIIANSSIIKTSHITEAENWEYVFEELPSNLSYTIMEKAVDGYSAEYSGDAANEFVIINKYTGETDPGTPIPPTDPEPPSDMQESEQTTETPEPKPPADTPIIPQTGTNTFPVYIIMLLGAVLVIVGLFDVFNARDEK